jgi:REP element-mobilizing transposase RayT
MARPLRLEIPGALYHLTTRGDRREPIYDDDADRRQFLDLLANALDRFDATAFAYCLMENHYHLVLQTHRANLSALMRHINGVYTQRYNRMHDKTGHLFQGRYKAIVVEQESYFLEVCRYVDLNPVRAKIVKHPRDWIWSSYRAHAGRVVGPAWLDSAALHRRLAARAPHRDGPRRYAEFVAAGRGVRLWEEGLSRQIYLGGDQFIKQLQTSSNSPETPDIPRAQRRKADKPLKWYFATYDRNDAIVEAHLTGGFSQGAIARETGLSPSRISRLISSHEAKGKT